LVRNASISRSWADLSLDGEPYEDRQLSILKITTRSLCQGSGKGPRKVFVPKNDLGQNFENWSKSLVNEVVDVRRLSKPVNAIAGGYNELTMTKNDLSPDRRRPVAQLFVLSFLALYFELIVIRWLSSEIRIFVS
jgi:hypothetical protein